MTDPRELGKWAVAGVPRKGWECLDVIDLDSQWQECEMCEREMIRFAHLMRHHNYPGVLEVGCVCAGHMMESLKAAKDMNVRAIRTAHRRAKFPDLKGWRESKAGNLTLLHDGYRFTIFASGPGYRASYALHSSPPVFSRLTHPTVRAAQLAVFNAVQLTPEKKARAFLARHQLRPSTLVNGSEKFACQSLLEVLVSLERKGYVYEYESDGFEAGITFTREGDCSHFLAFGEAP